MKLASLAILALLSGCAFTSDFFGAPQRTIILHAGESFSTSSDPKVNAELFAKMAEAFTPEMNAAIEAARIPGRTQ